MYTLPGSEPGRIANLITEEIVLPNGIAIFIFAGKERMNAITN